MGHVGDKELGSFLGSGCALTDFLVYQLSLELKIPIPICMLFVRMGFCLTTRVAQSDDICLFFLQPFQAKDDSRGVHWRRGRSESKTIRGFNFGKIVTTPLVSVIF